MNNPRRAVTAAILLIPILGACGGQLPPPETRSVIIYSGVRIHPESERMAEVEQWLRPQMEELETSRNTWVRIVRDDETRYPWDALELRGDTAEVRVVSTATDAETPFRIYAHFRLTEEKGTLHEWAPETEDLDGFEVEEAILTRVADVWLLGRSVFDTQPFGPLDELIYSSEFGYLEDFILATQGDHFPDERERYLEQRPERAEEFRDWFERTFERRDPGYLSRDEAPEPD